MSTSTISAKRIPKITGEASQPLAGEFSVTREQLVCEQLTLHMDGRAVAYAQLHRSADTTLEVVDLLVEPEYRGKGLGRRLLQHVIEFARSSGCARICAHASPDNGPAYRLFGTMGFHACETEVHLELAI